MPEEAAGKTGLPSERRQKPERPRDLLGRPQPWGDENQLEMPNFDEMTLEENHALGRRYVRERNFFPAHEAWETAWKQARGTDDAEFFKGLSQMGAGYVHMMRGNAHGTVTLLRRASSRVGKYPDGHHGIHTGALKDKLEADVARVLRGALVPGDDAAFDPPDVKSVPMSQVAPTEMEWRGRTGPFTILLNPGVFSPTHTSRTIAEALEIGPDDTVIDVGCGSGVLSFVAARMGAKRVIGCDISEEAVEAATKNAKRLGLDDRVEFRAGSLLDPVRDERATVLIGDVSGIPDEIAQVTGWFPDGRAGGPTGAELPSLMLQSIGDTLAVGGRLYLPTGTIQDEKSIIAAAHLVFGDNMETVMEREFPLPDIVGKSVAVARMMKEGLLNLHRRGSRWLWRLQIWRCIRT